MLSVKTTRKRAPSLGSVGNDDTTRKSQGKNTVTAKATVKQLLLLYLYVTNFHAIFHIKTKYIGLTLNFAVFVVWIIGKWLICTRFFFLDHHCMSPKTVNVMTIVLSSTHLEARLED